MGLDTSHGCWRGPYSQFNEWRTEIAKICGFNLYEMEGFRGPRPWNRLKPDTLHLLLNHSDCDGNLAWNDCAAIADRLEELLPQVSSSDFLRWRTQEWIKGLRLAHSLEEDVEFR